MKIKTARESSEPLPTAHRERTRTDLPNHTLLSSSARFNLLSNYPETAEMNHKLQFISFFCCLHFVWGRAVNRENEPSVDNVISINFDVKISLFHRHTILIEWFICDNRTYQMPISINRCAAAAAVAAAVAAAWSTFWKCNSCLLIFSISIAHLRFCVSVSRSLIKKVKLFMEKKRRKQTKMERKTTTRNFVESMNEWMKQTMRIYNFALQ